MLGTGFIHVLSRLLSQPDCLCSAFPAFCCKMARAHVAGVPTDVTSWRAEMMPAPGGAASGSPTPPPRLSVAAQPAVTPTENRSLASSLFLEKPAYLLASGIVKNHICWVILVRVTM